MRHRSVQSRAACLTAAAVMAVAGFGVTAAQADLLVGLKLSDNGGSSTTVAPGTVVNLDVFGRITGGSSDNFQEAFFGVTNTGTIGDLSTVSLGSTYQGVATDGTGVVTSTGGSLYGSAGSTSVGSTDSSVADGWVFARANNMQPAAPGADIPLGTLTFTVSNSAAAGASANLAVNTRSAVSNLIVPALWQEDSTLHDAYNGNGVYSAGPGVTITVQSAVQYLSGDFNHDKNVDGADFTIWSAHLGSSSGGLPSDQRYSVGDANSDGNVDGADFTIWAGQLGQSSAAPSGIALSTVPEPTTLGLTGILLCGLAARRRRA